MVMNPDDLLKSLKQIQKGVRPSPVVKTTTTTTPSGWKTPTIKAVGDVATTTASTGPSGLKGAALKVAAKTVGTVLKPLIVLDTPRRAVISGIRETVDALDSDPNTTASWNDFKKQTMDASYGFGTAFPMKGWAGRAIGFIGDVALDPITYATLGGAVPAKAVLKGTLTAAGKPMLTREALGGIKNITGRQGRAALAKLSKDRLQTLVVNGKKLTQSEINGIVKDVAARGKSAMPGFLRDDIGIRGPGIYYFGSRVKVPGSGVVGDLLERGLTSTRLALVSNKFKTNPGQYVQKLFTPDGTFQAIPVEPNTIRNFRIGLANGTLSPEQASMATEVLAGADFERLAISQATENATQGTMDIVGDPKAQRFKTSFHNEIERGTPPQLGDERYPLYQKIKNFFDTYADDVEMDAIELDPDFPFRKKENYFPHMESDEALKDRLQMGDEAFDKQLGIERVMSERQKLGSSFRQRRFKAGDIFFGHRLKEEDLFIDRMNEMARKPGDELNPFTKEKFKPINYDYYETDVVRVVEKYARQYANTKGYFAFVRYLKQNGPDFMAQLSRVVPFEPDAAGSKAMLLPKQLSDIGTKTGEIVTKAEKAATQSATAVPVSVAPTPTLRNYSGGYSGVGKGTSVGDGKDVAMRAVADSRIVELANNNPSSSLTTSKSLNEATENSKIIMLARNSELRNQPLKEVTDVQIRNAHARGAEFVVGDMPGVDSQFIDLLDEIGATYTIYHSGTTPRIAPTLTTPAPAIVAPSPALLVDETAPPAAAVLLSDIEPSMNELKTFIDNFANNFETLPHVVINMQETFNRLNADFVQMTRNATVEPEQLEKFADDMAKFNRDNLGAFRMNNDIPKKPISEAVYPKWYNENNERFNNIVGAVNGDSGAAEKLNKSFDYLKVRIEAKLGETMPEEPKGKLVRGISGSKVTPAMQKKISQSILDEEGDVRKRRLNVVSKIVQRWNSAKEAVDKANQVGVVSSKKVFPGQAQVESGPVKSFNTLNNFQVIDQVFTPDQRVARAVEAGFEVENLVHFNESLIELKDYADQIKATNIGLSVTDEQIVEVVTRHARPLWRNATSALNRVETQRLGLLTLRQNGVIDVDEAIKQIDNIVGEKDAVGKLLRSNYKLDAFVDPKEVNKRNIVSLKDPSSPKVTQRDIELYLKLQLGSGIENGILDIKAQKYKTRIEFLEDSSKLGQDVKEVLFPVNKTKTFKQLSTEVEGQPAVVKHNKEYKEGPVSAVQKQRKTELDGLPKTMVTDFVSYLKNQKSRAEKFRERIRNNIAPKAAAAQKDLDEFNAIHEEAIIGWTNDVLLALSPSVSPRQRNIILGDVIDGPLIEGYLRAKVREHFPAQIGFYEEFVQENKTAFDFLASLAVNDKTGAMTDFDFRIGVAMLQKEYIKQKGTGVFRQNVFTQIIEQFDSAGRPGVFSKPIDITYEQFFDVVTHTLGVKFMDDVNLAVAPTRFDLMEKVARQNEYASRLLSKAIVAEREYLTATPNNVFAKFRNQPLQPKTISEPTTNFGFRAKQIAMEESDFYPFAKSQENRANTLLALKDLDADKVDWTLGGRTQLVMKGQPFSVSPEKWALIVNTKNLSGLPGDEIDYILSWLRDDNVKQIVLGEDFAKLGSNISDEEMLSRFVNHVYKTQPQAVASDTARGSRAQSINSVWGKSDASKYLIEIDRLKQINQANAAAQQAQDPVRVIDSIVSESQSLSRRRVEEVVNVRQWADGYGTDTDDVLKELVETKKQMEEQFLREFEPYTQINRPQRKSSVSAAGPDEEYLRLRLQDVPESVLNGPLDELNQYMFNLTGQAYGLIERFNLRVDALDGLFTATPDEVAQLGEQRLLKEIEVLQTLKRNKIDTNATKGKIDDLIRQRRRILDTRDPQTAKDAAEAIAKDRAEMGPDWRNNLLSKPEQAAMRQQVDRMVSPVSDPEFIGAERVGEIGDRFYERATEGPAGRNVIGEGTSPQMYQQRLPDYEIRYEYNPDVNYDQQPFKYGKPSTEPPLAEQRVVITPQEIEETIQANESKMFAHNFNLLTQNISSQVKQAKLNSAPKGNAAKVAADVNIVDTAALEQIENAKQALKSAQKTGAPTPTEDVLINIGIQQAEILNTVADLPTETVEARLMDGLSGNMKPVSVVNADGSVTEIPVPDAATIVQQTLQDGWVRLSEYFPNIAVTKEFKELWDNAKYLEDPRVTKELTRYIGGFTKFHKAYATLTPGFHVRNIIGNSFQYILAGGKIENLKPASKIYFDWISAYKKGSTWEEFVGGLDEINRVAADTARNAMLGSGGGIYGDLFHEVIRGNKIYDNRVTRFSRKYGQMSDNMSRFILGFDSAKQGMDAGTATARVRKFYFDYEDLSQADRLMKQFVPFWIWSSRNLPLQLENMWLNPKPYAIYNSFVRNIRDKEAEEYQPLPSFLQEVEAFQLPGVGAYAAPDLNFTRIQQQLSQLANPKKFGTNLNPVFRLPVEQVIGQNLYNDKAIESTQDRLVNLLQGLVVPVATGDRLLNSYGDAKINAWLGFFGSPVRKRKAE